jgi:hypothetical protein
MAICVLAEWMEKVVDRVWYVEQTQISCITYGNQLK